jgi:hypothetical protein
MNPGVMEYWSNAGYRRHLILIPDPIPIRADKFEKGI